MLRNVTQMSRNVKTIIQDEWWKMVRNVTAVSPPPLPFECYMNRWAGIQPLDGAFIGDMALCVCLSEKPVLCFWKKKNPLMISSWTENTST